MRDTSKAIRNIHAAQKALDDELILLVAYNRLTKVEGSALMKMSSRFFWKGSWFRAYKVTPGEVHIFRHATSDLHMKAAIVDIEGIIQRRNK